MHICILKEQREYHKALHIRAQSSFKSFFAVCVLFYCRVCCCVLWLSVARRGRARRVEEEPRVHTKRGAAACHAHAHEEAAKHCIQEDTRDAHSVTPDSRLSRKGTDGEVVGFLDTTSSRRLESEALLAQTSTATSFESQRHPSLCKSCVLLI